MEFPSPHPGIINFFIQKNLTASSCGEVSVPSSGDYQFLPFTIHQGICRRGFRPLIRGLSISSSAFGVTKVTGQVVSVPSSGDYQFLRISTTDRASA